MKVGFKKKRKLKMLLSIMAIGCFSFLAATTAHAETSGNVPVTYTKSESVTYPLNVDVTGDGVVLTGSDTLRNQKKNYLLAVDESMTFELKADEGIKVKSVKLNGEDVMSKVKDSKISVEGQEKEQTLSISFEEKKNGAIFPQTGDTTKVGLYIILFIISLGAGGYMYYRDKKKLKNK